MTGKRLETILYSMGGVVLMFALLVALNVVTGIGKVRVDLTQEKLYTLTDGTKAILKNIDGEVEIRLYFSQGDGAPMFLKSYAARVEDLLDEYSQHANGKVSIKKLNPEPFSVEEDSASLDGVTGRRMPSGDQFYFGLAVSFLDQTETIAILDPERENLLEYDVSRAISSVLVEKKPKVGIMSSLPVMGAPPTPQAMRAGQFESTNPWKFVTVLKQDFEVSEVSLAVESIDEEIGVLLVVHPKGLSDGALFALDQFILRGGKLIVLMDPMPITDQSGVQQNMMGLNMAEASSLGKLMQAWGIEFDGTKAVADMSYTTKIPGREGAPIDSATVLTLTEDAIDRDDVVFGQIESLWLIFAGKFSGTPAVGLTKTSLIRSSDKAQMGDRIQAQLSHEEVVNNFKADAEIYDLGIRLSGKFKTAFPEGKPSVAAVDPTAKDAAAIASDALKESAAENSVVLIGNADFIADNFSFEARRNIFGQVSYYARNGNVHLIQSLVEQLAGDSNLIGTRSRSIKQRPFTVVKDIEQVARERHKDKEKEINEEIQAVMTRVQDLQKKRGDDKQAIRSADIQTEIDKANKELVSLNKERREIEKEKKRDIDALRNRLKWRNILAMPAVFILLGIGMAVFKRIRTSAR